LRTLVLLVYPVLLFLVMCIRQLIYERLSRGSCSVWHGVLQ
jgi:hypothetical protein